MLLKKIKKYIPAYLFLMAVLMNIAAWSSTSFCDFYVIHIFPFFVETYGRFSNMFPFSIGEYMLAAAVFLAVWLLLGGIGCLIRRKLWKPYVKYVNVCIWIGAIVCVVMTLNCLILYHCSPITQQYDIGGGEEQEFDFSQIADLRDYVVEQANFLSEQVERDENGYITYQGDMIGQAIAQMQRLGETYDRLGGYYPRPKSFNNSDFFSQQYIMGYYFPFSMEANYNTTMYVVNIPITLCHELSHLKGFIYEDEANFIGYLACVDSQDVLFRYSAYLSVIGYLDRDFYEAAGRNKDIYLSHPAISKQVIRDNVFLTPEAWEKVEDKAILDTQLVKEVSGGIVETNLTLNGVEDGMASYSRVVELLLKYYQGAGYGEHN